MCSSWGWWSTAVEVSFQCNFTVSCRPLNIYLRFPGASLCFTANNLQGICVPLHDCRSALYEITQLRSPDFCYRHSAIPHVCCINNRGNQPLQAGPQQSNWNNPPQDYYYDDDHPPPPPPPLPLPQATYPPPPLPEIDLRIPPSSPAVPGSDSPESGQRQLPDADSITFHRLAERSMWCHLFGS